MSRGPLSEYKACKRFKLGRRGIVIISIKFIISKDVEKFDVAELTYSESLFDLVRRIASLSSMLRIGHRNAILRLTGVNYSRLLHDMNQGKVVNAKSAWNIMTVKYQT